jgi:hypothetical protein
VADGKHVHGAWHDVVVGLEDQVLSVIVEAVVVLVDELALGLFRLGPVDAAGLVPVLWQTHEAIGADAAIAIALREHGGVGTESQAHAHANTLSERRVDLVNVAELDIDASDAGEDGPRVADNRSDLGPGAISTNDEIEASLDVIVEVKLIGQAGAVGISLDGLQLASPLEAARGQRVDEHAAELSAIDLRATLEDVWASLTNTSALVEDESAVWLVDLEHLTLGTSHGQELVIEATLLQGELSSTLVQIKRSTLGTRMAVLLELKERAWNVIVLQKTSKSETRRAS